MVKWLLNSVGRRRGSCSTGPASPSPRDERLAPGKAAPAAHPEPLAAAREGILLREAGDLASAEAVFLALTRDHPSKPYGWQELGVLHAQQGRHQNALGYFQQAVAAEPGDILPRTHYALHLLALDRLDEGDAVLADHPQAAHSERERVAALRQFLRFLKAWPEHRALEMANAYEHDELFLRAPAVEAAILEAVSQRRPFCLIRVGDGEGAWLQLGAADEAAYPDLYQANRGEFLRLWFGEQTAQCAEDFRLVSARLSAAMDAADVLGLPYSLRVAHEYRVKSSRGVPSSVNALRWLTEPARRLKFTCSQDIHLELQHSGFYRRLLELGAPVGVISCHPDMARIIEGGGRSRVVQSFLVPEEKGFSHILGVNGVDEPHFPSVFERVAAGLRAEDQSGRVWLVAAGILGKIYCDVIRERGGVAIDIGSIADGWFGMVTRPTLSDIARFRL